MTSKFNKYIGKYYYQPYKVFADRIVVVVGVTVGSTDEAYLDVVPLWYQPDVDRSDTAKIWIGDGSGAAMEHLRELSYEEMQRIISVNPKEINPLQIVRADDGYFLVVENKDNEIYGIAFNLIQSKVQAIPHHSIKSVTNSRVRKGRNSNALFLEAVE